MKEQIERLVEQLENSAARLNQSKQIAGGGGGDQAYLSQLEQSVQALTAKCERLADEHERETASLREQADQLRQLHAQMDACNREILACSSQFDARLISDNSSFNNSILDKTNFERMLDQLREYERDALSPIAQNVANIVQATAQIPSASLKYKCELLGHNLDSLQSKFETRVNKLNGHLLKTAEFDEKRSSLSESLARLEQQLADLASSRFHLDNLELVEAQLSRVQNEFGAELRELETRTDEFKEASERIMQIFDEDQVLMLILFDKN